MVTGQLPFEGETPLSTAMKHKGEIPIDPREFNPEIPEDLSFLILKCMEKEKEKRYQNEEGALKALDYFQQAVEKDPDYARDYERAGCQGRHG